jgi:hypothetical protein
LRRIIAARSELSASCAEEARLRMALAEARTEFAVVQRERGSRARVGRVERDPWSTISPSPHRQQRYGPQTEQGTWCHKLSAPALEEPWKSPSRCRSRRTLRVPGRISEEPLHLALALDEVLVQVDAAGRQVGVAEAVPHRGQRDLGLEGERAMGVP